MRDAARGAASVLLALALASGCSFGAGADGNATASETGGSTSTTGGPGMVDHDTCGAAGSNSALDETGQCWCLIGYTWTNPYDPSDFGCQAVEPRVVPCDQACDATAIATGECSGDGGGSHSCDCADGQRWCSPPPQPADTDASTEPLDTRCCIDHAQPQPGADDTSTSSSATGTSSDGTRGSSEGGSSSATSSSGDTSGGSTASGTSEQ